MAIEGLDLETLLAPIEGEQPAGIDMRTDFSPKSNYFRLRDARAEARAAERAADADPGMEGAAAEFWRDVRSLSLKILSEQAKDLEAAAWLTEALVRSNGLAGLAFGADLIRGLVERYWEQLYPMPDEDGIETRVSPVTGLNGEGGDGTLSQPLMKLPLFKDQGGNPILLYQYDASAELQTIADPVRLEARLAAGAVPFDKMEAMARANPKGNLVAAKRAADEALAAWTAMGDALDAVAASYAPPTRRVRDAIERVAAILARYLPAEETAAGDAPEAADAADADAADAGGGTRGKGRRLATREDAFATLAEIAEFFRRTEPQSPIAYTITDAVRRGRLSWPELMEELVQDFGTRSGILTSLGIKVQPPGDGY